MFCLNQLLLVSTKPRMPWGQTVCAETLEEAQGLLLLQRAQSTCASVDTNDNRYYDKAVHFHEP